MSALAWFAAPGITRRNAHTVLHPGSHGGSPHLAGGNPPLGGHDTGSRKG
jgi:hypothetical protein